MSIAIIGIDNNRNVLHNYLVDSFDEQLENTKVDYHELPSPREGMEFKTQAQRDQFLGGGGKPPEAKNTSGTFQEQQNKREQQPITAPKGEVERFRIQSAWEEALNRFLEATGENSIHDNSTNIIEVSMAKDPEKIFTYLSSNWNDLSEQEKFFLQVTGEKRKFERREYPETGQTVTLQGDEAKRFTQIREAREFDEALSKLIESNDPQVDEVIRVTTQSDPEKVAEYISKHQAELSPLALDFLLRSLRIKISK
jgi:hypothetical protein